MAQIAVQQGQIVLVAFGFLEEKMLFMNVKVVTTQLLGLSWNCN